MSNVVINPFVFAGASFVPTDIAELERWYDADLSDFTAGTWEDLSDNGVDVTQATAGNRPTANATGINGQPSLTFDGTNDRLTNTTVVMRDLDKMTALVITDASAQSGGACLLMEGASNGTNQLYIVDRGGAGDTTNVFIRQNNFQTVINADGPDDVYDGNVSFHGVKIDQTAEEVVWIDELTESTATAFSQSIGPVTLNQHAIGCQLRTTASNFFTGELGAVLIFSKLLSSTELENVRDYYVDRGYLSAL